MRRTLLALCLAAGCSGPAGVGSATDPLLVYPTKISADYADSVTGVKYHGGPVLTGDANLHLLFYGTLEQSTKDLLVDFANNLSGSPQANVLTTFGDGNGNRPSGHFNVDAPSLAGITIESPLDNDVMSRVIHDLDGDNPDPNGIYVFVTGNDIDVLTSDGVSYCGSNKAGWHHTVPVGTKNARIEFIGNAAFCRGGAPCPAPGASSGCIDTDQQAQIIWHETAEAITDSQAGYTPEIGDLCGGPLHSDDPGTPAVGFVQLDLDYPVNGAFANVHLGNHDYSLEPMWQNVAGGGCVHRLALYRPSVPLHGQAAGDLNYDSIGDLILHNSSNGNVLSRIVDGFGNFGTAHVLDTAGPGAEIYGVADFNGDSVSDLLWRYFDSGRLTMWELGPGGVSSHVLATSIPVEWAIKAVGDFDGNGYADILFMNLTTNQVRMWHNNGSLAPFIIDALPGISPIPNINDNLDSVGAGDLDGDGKSDVLWYHIGSDTYRYWTFSGNSDTATTLPRGNFDYVLGLANIGGVAVPIAVSGTQIVWVDRTGGAHLVGPKLDADWRYSGASKFAGQTSLLWRSRKSGDVYRWLLSSTGAVQSTQMALHGEGLDRQIIAF